MRRKAPDLTQRDERCDNRNGHASGGRYGRGNEQRETSDMQKHGREHNTHGPSHESSERTDGERLEHHHSAELPVAPPTGTESRKL